MCQARLLFWRPEYSGWPDRSTIWLWIIVATSLAVLAYFLYRAHNWARLTLIGLCVCLLATLIWFSVAAEINEAHMLAQSNEWRLSRVVESVLDHFGLYLSVFAPLVFIIGALCHREIAATFRTSITERSNQAMQRTPSGSSPSTSND
jgi:hypothetical protein